MDSKCPYCLDSYNITDKIQMTLTCLTHTICSDCLTFLLKSNSPVCPFDLTPIDKNILLSLCKTHNKQINALCKNHYLLLCQNCLQSHNNCNNLISNFATISNYIQNTLNNSYEKHHKEQEEFKNLFFNYNYIDIFHLFKNDSDNFFSEFGNLIPNKNFKDLAIPEKIEEIQKIHKIVNNREVEVIRKRDEEFESFLKLISCHNPNDKIAREIDIACVNSKIVQLFDKISENDLYDGEFSAVFENLDDDLKIISIGFICPNNRESMIYIDYFEINNMNSTPFVMNDIVLEENPGRICLDIDVREIIVKKRERVSIFINMRGFCNLFEGLVESEKYKVFDTEGRNYDFYFPILYFKVESI
ncbi:hypothetical protein SteCoe_12109 [Stentor coeruleus]|uniref:RING-type domain-containing protein n=1 Tax=Stentor coeruleus TaxID=5963 RepID=A0A1R2CBK5_9CILI|nr:hypothetical protein SteCoe_12109 [Stentor coeruleus]